MPSNAGEAGGQGLLLAYSSPLVYGLNGAQIRIGQEWARREYSMAAAKINAPTRYLDDPLYLTECRLALEPSLTSLAEHAVKAGWPPKAVSYSLMILSAEMLQQQSGDEPPPPDVN
jgi:hypothetical protein